ncbi:MAG: PD-(D/E)XK nuclease family protein [Lachnospiraceae bacterium]|jgi:ATP-dependent helicase/nuclease subunit B|nr:PD-(D/E)XK nuclease family protein [Lachnospiraceae bacterium]
MSLQFYLGAAGTGKSWKLNHDLIKWSLAKPNQRFFLIVPDQFTMHTQMELVKSHPRRGIMNIEVLSFARLAHRVFTEVGVKPPILLDDTGKSLILRKVAANITADLPVIGKSLMKPGYISELKSTISELMQYAISPTEMTAMVEFAARRGALAAKLSDIRRLYEEFLIFIKDNFITTEETLELLRTALPQSDLIRGSVVAFDGFTGFTPIQNRLMQNLMGLTERVIVTVVRGNEGTSLDDVKERALDHKEHALFCKERTLFDKEHTLFYKEQASPHKEHTLFYLSDKTIADLTQLADEVGVKRMADVIVGGTEKAGVDRIPRRFSSLPAANELAHLERYLFRYPVVPYQGESTAAIQIFEARAISDEVRRTFIEIKKLVTEQNHSYREIAIIAGDMKRYARLLEREAVKYQIPLYLDRTQGILLNPFTEFIRSALRVINKNYSYEAIFHFLRSGFVDMTNEEVDDLENYVLACGIRGKKMWQESFIRTLSKWNENEICEKLEILNALRTKILTFLAPLNQGEKTAAGIVTMLYDFIVGGRSQAKLAVYEQRFHRDGDMVRAKEYAQIYRLVMELLEQIHGLLKDEPMKLDEFAEILDAGLAEIKIGTIPQSIDRVVVGDIERTRLSQVRTLFFLGVNDGSIPQSGSGGLLSALDREFLQSSKWELAPSQRQKLYIERLYLYITMTRPAERLYLSYARVDSEGKSLRPSYLIAALRRVFPLLLPQKVGDNVELSEIYGLSDSYDLFTSTLRRYAEGSNERLNSDFRREHPWLITADFRTLMVLGYIYRKDEGAKQKLIRMVEQAFYRYTHHPLTRFLADMLYGEVLQVSISRLEKYAACAYAHFLRHGLSLALRDEYGFEAVDLGVVYHSVLARFAELLREESLDWADFSNTDGERLLTRAISEISAGDYAMVLRGSARNEQLIGRIHRVMARTIQTLRWQMEQGDFRYMAGEIGFHSTSFGSNGSVFPGDGGVLEIEAEEEAQTAQFSVKGQIDRIDICKTAAGVLVKVVDYKSGSSDIDFSALYHGLQLQLIVYLSAAVEFLQRENPGKDIIPAAALYYQVFDPLIEEDKELNDDELAGKLLGLLRMKGVVNADGEIIRHIDRGFDRRSQVIPVEQKKDGSFSATSRVISAADFTLLSEYTRQKIKKMALEIKNGDISLNPYQRGTESSCAFCEYQNICGHDPRRQRKRRLEKRSRSEIIELMKEENEVNIQEFPAKSDIDINHGDSK